jgi:hypothetical protein
METSTCPMCPGDSPSTNSGTPPSSITAAPIPVPSASEQSRPVKLFAA